MRNFSGDLAGKQFGRLTVLAAADDRCGQKCWMCRCACGKEKAVAANSLQKGLTTSCGCYRQEVAQGLGKRSRTHGETGSRAYQVWANMLSRCNNPRSQSYKDYGARGIKVDPAWHTFSVFHADMGDPPPGLWIERRANYQGYSKGNCYWGTPTEQGNNKRNNVVLHWKGQSLTASQWAKLLGFTPQQILLRIGRGWSADRALSTPTRKYR